jgi:hypothetical protein
MDLKRPRALSLYRASGQELPSAQMDALVLTAARAQPVPSLHRRNVSIAVAAAASVAAAFYLRLAPIRQPELARQYQNDFGIAEARSDAYLMSFDFQTPTGPGSHEGLP